jgi:hypothetical protein
MKYNLSTFPSTQDVNDQLDAYRKRGLKYLSFKQVKLSLIEKWREGYEAELREEITLAHDNWKLYQSKICNFKVDKELYTALMERNLERIQCLKELLGDE